MEQISEIQARVLACLMEKERTTPDQYPLTINSLRNACNQKSSRFPVTAYTEGEVGHTIRELESLGLVREVWGARVAKYEHCAGKAFGLYAKGMAILCTLVLRGPQTLSEVKTHTHRLFEFDDLDDVLYALGKMAESDPPLVTPLPRQPGQKEGRYAHLVCGEPDVSVMPVRTTATLSTSGLDARVADLESQLAVVTERLDQLENKEPG